MKQRIAKSVNPRPSVWSQAFALCLARGRVSSLELAQVADLPLEDAALFLAHGANRGYLRLLGSVDGGDFYDLAPGAVAITAEVASCA
jgi:hypothetical protein